MFLTENISEDSTLKLWVSNVYLSQIQYLEMQYLLNYFKSFHKLSNPESIFTVMGRVIKINYSQATSHNQLRNPKCITKQSFTLWRSITELLCFFLFCLQILLPSAKGLEAFQTPARWGSCNTVLACEPHHRFFKGLIGGRCQSNNVQ